MHHSGNREIGIRKLVSHKSCVGVSAARRYWEYQCPRKIRGYQAAPKNPNRSTICHLDSAQLAANSVDMVCGYHRFNRLYALEANKHHHVRAAELTISSTCTYTPEHC